MCSRSMRDVVDGKPGASMYATRVQVEEAYKDGFPEMLILALGADQDWVRSYRDRVQIGRRNESSLAAAVLDSVD